jgi:hypothetical protein
MIQVKERAKALAQDLFNKAVVPVMDLPLSDETIKVKGLEIALLMLDQVYDRNTFISLNDMYCEAQGILHRGEVEY